MDDINTLTEYFYYKYPNMKKDIKQTIELDVYTLYIEFKNGTEFTYDAHDDGFIDITNSTNLEEDVKQYRFRMMLLKQMRKYRLNNEMIYRRTRNRTIKNV